MVELMINTQGDNKNDIFEVRNTPPNGYGSKECFEVGVLVVSLDLTFENAVKYQDMIGKTSERKYKYDFSSNLSKEQVTSIQSEDWKVIEINENDIEDKEVI